MDIALKSIESVLSLDFDDYEVVIVDMRQVMVVSRELGNSLRRKSQVMLGLSSLGVMRIGVMQVA
jgi:hypothetical protein